MRDTWQILLAESFIDMFLEYVDLKQLVRDVYAHERQTAKPVGGSTVPSVSPLGLQASKLPATTTQVRKAPAGLGLYHGVHHRGLDQRIVSLHDRQAPPLAQSVQPPSAPVVCSIKRKTREEIEADAKKQGAKSGG